MAFFQGRPKARGRVVTQSNFIYTPANGYVWDGEYNIVVILHVVSMWKYFLLHVFVAYLLHVTSCY